MPPLSSATFRALFSTQRSYISDRAPSATPLSVSRSLREIACTSTRLRDFGSAFGSAATCNSTRSPTLPFSSRLRSVASVTSTPSIARTYSPGFRLRPRLSAGPRFSTSRIRSPLPRYVSSHTRPNSAVCSSGAVVCPPTPRCDAFSSPIIRYNRKYKSSFIATYFTSGRYFARTASQSWPWNFTS